MTTLNLTVHAGSPEAANLGKHVTDVIKSLLGDNQSFTCIPKPRYSRDEDIIHITANFTLQEIVNRGSGIVRGTA